jgi:hypothetical protein
MEASLGLEAIRQLLLRRGAPGAYVERLIGELAEHRADLVHDLMRDGRSLDQAGLEADRRLGEASALVEAAFVEMRRNSFVGRHRLACLIVLPVVVLPLSWTIVLVLAAWTTGMLAPGFHVGTMSAQSRVVISIACGACNFAMPAALGAAFWLLARRRFCGRVWSWAAGLALAVVSSFLFARMFSSGGGRLVVGVALLPDPVKLSMPIVLILAMELARGVGRRGARADEPPRRLEPAASKVEFIPTRER